jgi:hypothetical protein
MHLATFLPKCGNVQSEVVTCPGSPILSGRLCQILKELLNGTPELFELGAIRKIAAMDYNVGAVQGAVLPGRSPCRVYPRSVGERVRIEFML